MIRFYIVRHGQTLFNQKDMVQGWCDSPLTLLGQNQAKAVGIGLKDICFNFAYSSISERAYDTASAIIGTKDVPITMDKRLKEFNFGTLEGEKNSALMAGRPGEFKDIIKTGWIDVGGENEMMVRTRVREFFDEITHTYKDANILVTSHGMTILAILEELIFADKDDQGVLNGIENCSVNVIEYNHGCYELKELNNITYRNEGLLQL